MAVPLPNNVRQLRQERNWTLDHLAGLIGVSTPHLSEVERGLKNLNNHLIDRLASAFEVPAAMLFEQDQQFVGLAWDWANLNEEDRGKVAAFAKALRLISNDLTDE